MPGVLPGTPREDGFRMPAEWEPHDGLLPGVAGAARHLAGRRQAGAGRVGAARD